MIFMAILSYPSFIMPRDNSEFSWATSLNGWSFSIGCTSSGCQLRAEARVQFARAMVRTTLPNGRFSIR
jgi:hypothetical protein